MRDSETRAPGLDADQLLHEAQYAFGNISYGDTPQNRKYAARAKALARKVLRKYPHTTAAYSAREILRRLGDEAYEARFDHAHSQPLATSEAQSHQPHQLLQQRPETALLPETDAPGDESLNWLGMVAWFFRQSKPVIAVILFFGFFLFGLFGPLLILPLILLILFTGPLKFALRGEQRRQADRLIVNINRFIAGERSG